MTSDASGLVFCQWVCTISVNSLNNSPLTVTHQPLTSLRLKWGSPPPPCPPLWCDRQPYQALLSARRGRGGQ